MNNFFFIDGSNLYAGQYEIFDPNKYLDFTKFISYVEFNLGKKFDSLFFYASYSPRPQSLSPETKKYLTYGRFTMSESVATFEVDCKP